MPHVVVRFGFRPGRRHGCGVADVLVDAAQTVALENEEQHLQVFERPAVRTCPAHSVEFGELLKISFAEHGTKANTLASLAAARAWARERNELNLAVGRPYLAGEGPFPQRAAQNTILGGFFTEFYRMVDTWAAWATGQVEQWLDNLDEAPADLSAMKHVVRRASW